MMHSTELNAIFESLSKAQSKMEGAKKDASNPYFKSKYADLASVWLAAKDALTENGLTVLQTVEVSDTGVATLCTILGHKSGQWIKSAIPMNPQKPDPQSMGSLITYYRRYALAAMVGVCPEDDDGEAATKPYREKPPIVEEAPVKAEDFWKIIPEDISDNEVDKFLLRCATGRKETENKVMADALKNPDGFVKALRATLEKKKKEAA